MSIQPESSRAGYQGITNFLDAFVPAGARLPPTMEQGRQDAGLALRVLVRFGVHEGVPAYIAVVVVILLLLVLSELH